MWNSVLWPTCGTESPAGSWAKVNLANSRESEHEGYVQGYNARLVVIRD